MVIDTVGAATLRSSVRSLAQYGRLALLGEVGGEGSLRGVIPEIVFRDARVTGVSGVSRKTLEQAVALASGGEADAGVAGGYAAGRGGAGAGDGGARAVLGRVVIDARSLIQSPEGSLSSALFPDAVIHWSCQNPAVVSVLHLGTLNSLGRKFPGGLPGGLPLALALCLLLCLAVYFPRTIFLAAFRQIF